MRIVALTDMALSGSGYLNLSTPVFQELTSRGHEIKVSGLGYRGTEHDWDFSILSAVTMKQAVAIVQNLYNGWGFDVLMVLLDIPVHEKLLQIMPDRPFKYVGVMPVESDPLCMSWAMVLTQMDKAFIISEFGTQEAIKLGVTNAEYLQVGVDTSVWRSASAEERDNARQSFGFTDDTFVVLTVADNQERKNLSRSMEIFKDFSSDKKDVKYILVTREHNPVGWRLRDYAQELGISNDLMLFERGMPFRDLWKLYILSDIFLLTSKAEGLGMPLLEAMAVNLPCLATNCTGMKELLSSKRGYLINHDYVHRDPFGNGRRYWASRKDGVNILNDVYNLGVGINLTKRAREHVEKRDWKSTVDKLESVLLEVIK